MRCEVAILGAGITGAWLADVLSEDGHEVLVLDRRDAGWGSTSASTALLQYEIDTPLVDLIDRYGRRHAERAYRACFESIDRIAERVARFPRHIDFVRKDSVFLASREKDVELLRREHKARGVAGIETCLWSRADVEKRFSFSQAAALHSRQAAQVDAYQLTHALLQAAQQSGARIADRTEVMEVECGSRGVVLKTDRGMIRAQHLVVASGYETLSLFSLQEAIRLHSTYAVVSEPMEKMDGWWRQCLLWESGHPYHYLRTTSDGRAIIGGGDVPFRAPRLRDALLKRKTRKLIETFQEWFPCIPFECGYAWAGTFAETEDGLAYIGRHARFPHCHFALGFGGNGITYSVIAGEILRAHLRGKSHPDARVFAFDR